MPNVIYQNAPEVAPAGPGGIPGGGFQHLQTSPATFGSLPAAALQHMGAETQQAGGEVFQAYQRQQQLYNETVANEATNNFQDSATKALYGDPATGDTGFFGKSGRDAMDAYPSVRDAMLQSRAQIGGNLNARAKLQFDAETRRMQTFMLEQMGRHYDQQQKAYEAATNKASIDLSGQNAALNYNDPVAFMHSLSDAATAGQRQARAMGAPSGSAVEREHVLDATSHVIQERAKALIKTDPGEARKMIDTYRPMIREDTYAAINSALRTGQAASAVDRALGTAQGAPGPTPGIVTPDQVGAAAQTAGVDPVLANATAAIESGHGANVGQGEHAATRGNIFQMGPSERASVGGGVGIGSPDEQVRQGVAFLGKKKEEMTAALGREPTNAEIYLAHQQGTGGAVALLSKPNERAGSVVPGGDAAIRANGGDPDAPAKAFTDMWRQKYAAAERRFAGGAAAVGNAYVIGDSLGVGMKSQGKLEGDAVGGRNPTAVLAAINQQAPNLKGKTVLLSTGASNGAGQVDEIVPQQLEALKSAGANAVMVGVDDKKYPGVNAKLADIAQKNGVPFTGAAPIEAGSEVHPSPRGYRQMLQQFNQVRQGARQSGQPQPTIASNVRADYATAYANLLNDPSLDAETRQKAISDLHSRMSFEQGLAEKEDREANQKMVDAQKSKWSSVMAGIVSGKPPTNEDLAQMLATRQIDQSQFASIQGAMSGRGEKDDTQTYADLNRRARRGDDVSEDVFHAVATGLLKPQTGDSILNMMGARQQHTEDQVVSHNFATLRTAAGMDAQEHPMVDLGREAQQAQVALWSQAQQEWNDRVFVKKENSNDVLADMLSRYSHPVETTHALPRPRLAGTGEIKLEDVPDITKRTQDAVNSGQMTQERGNEEYRLLQKYYQMLDADQKRQTALKNAPKTKGGGRNVEIAPSTSQ